MNQTNTSQYLEADLQIKNEVLEILNGNFEQCVLGTIDHRNYPYLSKVIPLYTNNKILLLLSDLSDHTQHININKKVSLFFVLKENYNIFFKLAALFLFKF